MQRYFSDKLENNKLIINDNDYHHITKVMRMKEKDRVEVVYNKEVYLCELLFNQNIEADIIKKIESDIKKNIDITIVIPLLKEHKMDLILQKATELGVSTIIPVITERSIIKIDAQKENKKIERWTKICKEASEQSMRTTIPNITEIKTFKDLQNLDGVKLICSTTEKSINLKTFLKNNRNYDKMITVIGPEGGLTNKEENYLEEIGFTKISLGPLIMRVETVPLFLLSIINYEFME